MGFKNFWNKMMGTAGGEGNDDEYTTDEDPIYDEPEEVQPRQAAAYRPSSSISAAQQAKPLKMVIVEPETFDDSQGIADYLRDRKPVVINFENTDSDVSKRIVDFVSGSTYALDGNIQKVGKDIFLCVPSNVSVDRNKHDYAPDFAEPLAWKDRSNSGQ
jgi:cell division inhibitor SepF